MTDDGILNKIIRTFVFYIVRKYVFIKPFLKKKIMYLSEFYLAKLVIRYVNCNT